MLIKQLRTIDDVNILKQTHICQLPPSCPVSGNPQQGSTIRISYVPADCFIEVYSLQDYLRSYVGGKYDIRDMEGMIQQITKDCAEFLSVKVTAEAHVLLDNGDEMIIECEAP